MTFPAVSGHTNLPNGKWSPIIYSKKAQLAFRKNSVVMDITNTDYAGEIKDMGDTVKIITEPTMTIRDYGRGTQIQVEDIVDAEITMTVDQAKYFAFKVDDIEAKQAHVNWESLATDQAGYRLKDGFDSHVLSYMKDNLTAAYTVGTNSAPQAVNFTGGADMTPLQLMARLSRFLDVQNVPEDDRWFVADPVFWESLSHESSKVMDASFTGDGKSPLRNNKMLAGQLRGFTCYKSNNLPAAGSGPSATGNSNYGVILAGHKSAVATVEQILKTESYRDPNSFADIVRGMHVFGRKVLRAEGLVGAYYNADA